jgi:hypothetical protein
VQPMLEWKSDEYYTTWASVVVALKYPACNAHAPYCYMWPAPLYIIIPHYVINGTIFWQNGIEHKRCALIFSTNFV